MRPVLKSGRNSSGNIKSSSIAIAIVIAITIAIVVVQ